MSVLLVAPESSHHVRITGSVLLVLATATIGLLGLVIGDFAYTWQPVPETLPGRALLARLTGLIFIAVSIVFALPRTRYFGLPAIVGVFWPCRCCVLWWPASYCCCMYRACWRIRAAALNGP